MLSPLQLKQHRFTDFSVESIPTGLPNHEALVTTSSTWGHIIGDELSWKVELKVMFGPDEARKLSPYRGKVSIIGFFKVAKTWPAEKRQELVGVNGASVLYSAVREMVLIVTGRSSHGELMLPTMSFTKLIDKPKAAAPAEEKRKVKKKRLSPTPS